MVFYDKNKTFLLSLLLIGLIWWAVTDFHLIDELFLPSPSLFFEAFTSLFLSRDFGYDILISVWRVVFAWSLSFIFAVPVAFLMSNSIWANRLLSPYVDFLRYLPVPVLIPLIILFFGIGESAKIALLFIGTFFQLVLLIHDDLNDIPKEYYNIGFSLNFSFFRIQLMKFKAIAPNLWNNCRITMGWCWTYLVIAELVASKAGIGYVIKEAQRFSKTPEIYVGIFIMGVIGFFSDTLWRFFYPKIFRYKSIKNL